MRPLSPGPAPDRTPRTATRTTALWVPDWPVAAALVAERVGAHVPAAVHDGRRVTAVSATARAQGVRRGMRRRQAQGCCPQLLLLAADDVRDVRLFEPVALAAETVVPGVEVMRPGLLLLPTGGAQRYHGSEDRLGMLLVDAVATSGHECGVGTADGLLAAILAARTGAVVAPGASALFLAEHGVGELVHATTQDAQATQVTQLVDLLHRLGLRTLGSLAALPSADVHARFGALGGWAHTLARGLDLRPPARRRPAPDLSVAADLDPPAARVDTAAFAGRRLAEQLTALLAEHAVTCGRLQITARTDSGAQMSRTWRTDSGWGGLTPARITDRVRWQLEGWITSAALAGRGTGDEDDEPAALVHLGLTALDVAGAGAQQPRLWGGPSGTDLRAQRALDRVQGLLGGTAVLTATVQGGRDPREQVHLRPWGDQTAPPRRLDLPWPGRLPDPAPAVVPDRPLPVDLTDPEGLSVRVDPRGALAGSPAWLGRAGEARSRPPDEARGPRGDRAGEVWRDERSGCRVRVVGWAGPWRLLGRWWATPSSSGPGASGVRTYLQVLLDDGAALLLSHPATPDGHGWLCEAGYD